MVDADGVVTEGSSSNAWIVTKDGKLITRPATNEILNGFTRRTIIKLAQEAGIDLEERPFTLGEAKSASEAFLSSATSLATPATSIDGQKIGDGKVGPVTADLQAHYLEFAKRGRRRA